MTQAFEGAYGAYCVTNFWEHFSPETRAGAGAQHGARGEGGGPPARDLVDARGHARLGPARRRPHAHADGQVQGAPLRRQGRGEPLLHAMRGVPTTFLLTSFYWENLIYFGMGPQRGEDGVAGDDVPARRQRRCRASPSRTSASCAYGDLQARREFIGKTVGDRRRAPDRRGDGRRADDALGRGGPRTTR